MLVKVHRDRLPADPEYIQADLRTDKMRPTEDRPQPSASPRVVLTLHSGGRFYFLKRTRFKWAQQSPKYLIRSMKKTYLKTQMK